MVKPAASQPARDVPKSQQEKHWHHVTRIAAWSFLSVPFRSILGTINKISKITSGHQAIGWQLLGRRGGREKRYKAREQRDKVGMECGPNI